MCAGQKNRIEINTQKRICASRSFTKNRYLSVHHCRNKYLYTNKRTPKYICHSTECKILILLTTDVSPYILSHQIRHYQQNIFLHLTLKIRKLYASNQAASQSKDIKLTVTFPAKSIFLNSSFLNTKVTRERRGKQVIIESLHSWHGKMIFF